MSLYKDNNKYRRRRVAYLSFRLRSQLQFSAPRLRESSWNHASPHFFHPCAGGNRSSARACCLGREEHEYTATDKGYEAAWLAASHKRPQILTSRHVAGTQLTGLRHPERNRRHRRTKDTLSFPSSKRERTDVACYLHVYPVSAVPELKTTDEPPIFFELQFFWRKSMSCEEIQFRRNF